MTDAEIDQIEKRQRAEAAYLRKHAPHRVSDAKLFDAAADTLAALRRERNEANKWADLWRDKWEAIEAEVARLREALSDIALTAASSKSRGYCQRRARAALNAAPAPDGGDK